MSNKKDKQITLLRTKVQTQKQREARMAIKFVETDVKPGEFLHSWPVRMGFRVSALFGEKNEFAEFQATTQTRHFFDPETKEEFIIENMPTPEVVDKCADIIRRAYRPRLDTSCHNQYDGVNIIKENGEKEYVSFDDIDQAYQRGYAEKKEYTIEDVKDVLRKLYEFMPYSTPVQYVDCVNILLEESELELSREEIIKMVDDIHKQTIL